MSLFDQASNLGGETWDLYMHVGEQFFTRI